MKHDALRHPSTRSSDSATCVTFLDRARRKSVPAARRRSARAARSRNRPLRTRSGARLASGNRGTRPSRRYVPAGRSPHRHARERDARTAGSPATTQPCDGPGGAEETEGARRKAAGGTAPPARRHATRGIRAASAEEARPAVRMGPWGGRAASAPPSDRARRAVRKDACRKRPGRPPVRAPGRPAAGRTRQPMARRALRNIRNQGDASGQSAGCQLKLTVRRVRSGCGIRIVARPSRLVRPAMASTEPLGLAG